MTNASTGVRREGCRHGAQTSQSCRATAVTHMGSFMGNRVSLQATLSLLSRKGQTADMMLSTIVITDCFLISPTDGAKGQL